VAPTAGRPPPLRVVAIPPRIVAARAAAQLYTLSGSARPWSSYFESVVDFLRIHATVFRLEVTPFRLDGTIIDRGRVSLTPRPM
jgi:hypothetical protein